MKHLKLFEAFNDRDRVLGEVRNSPYLIASKEGIYLFSFGSFDTWDSFLNSHVWLCTELKWPLNPKLTSSAENYFNRYLERFPIFCFIIDANSKNMYGASLDQSGKLGVFVDKASMPQNHDLFFEYLDKLGLTIGDL